MATQKGKFSFNALAKKNLIEDLGLLRETLIAQEGERLTSDVRARIDRVMTLITVYNLRGGKVQLMVSRNPEGAGALKLI